MKRITLLVLFALVISNVNAQTWPASLVGRWTFDNSSNLLQATVGSPLVLTGTHAAVSGSQAGDGAVAVDVGSYYTCTHGIADNGGSTGVNEYSLLFDIMISNPTQYHSLFQTNMANSNDGDCFINTNSQIGITATGYSGFSLKARNWYRIVICVDNASSYRIYVDGHQVLEGIAQPLAGTYALDPSVLFFADENSEDNLIYASQIAIFNNCLTAAEVAGLGGFRTSNIKPYLQTPTPSSMYVSWYAWDNSSTIVQCGTTTALGSSIPGSYEDIGANRWHTVQLLGLNPDTRYYYRCISGSDTSAIYHFRTPAVAGTPGKHIRFIKVGDTQANDNDISRRIADTIVFQMEQLYGNDWMDSISFVMHSGDLNQDGSTLGRYMNEFFNPYSVISAYVPIMVSIGNHEGESIYFYQFMKYSDLTGLSEKYYTFQLGDCQFIALNTSGTYNNILQTNWVQTQLNTSATDPSVDFVFIYNHQPGHSELWPDGNNSYVENTLLPIFKNYPKLVMNTYGHSHNYERGTILSTHGNNWDFRTVLCGGGGGALDRWLMYANQVDHNDIQKTIDHYCFSFLDVDQDAKTVDFTTYSLGNTDLGKNLEVIDRWHRYLNQAAPNKPQALWPDSIANSVPVLTASPYSGIDSLMSSRFQLVPISGSFSSPLIDIIRDNEDLYGNSGSPSYIPTNKNAGYDLKRYAIDPAILSVGTTYMWRMCYRDQNVRWSDWSDTLMFTVVDTPANEVDFIADITTGPAPLTVQFTDLSVYNPSSWNWDLDGDGFSEATTQDVTYTYNTPGLYNISLTATVDAQSLTATKNFYINVLTASSPASTPRSGFEIFPNPSDSGLEFIFSTDNERVSINIYDLQGKRLNCIFDGKMTAGNHRFYWDGTDKNGNMLAPGLYVCRYRSERESSTIKLVRE